MRNSDWSSDVCSSDLVLSTAAVVRGRSGVIVCGTPGTGCTRGTTIRSGPVAAPSDRPDIGRASCRDRVCQYVSIAVVAVSFNKNETNTQKNTHVQHI